MNIFYLDKDPKLAAQYHCDTHVVKMPLEAAQLLCVAHRVLDGTKAIRISPTGRKLQDWILPDYREQVLYEATHFNHPCAIWVRQSKQHYIWLYHLFIHLCGEFTSRYGKVHLSEHKLSDVLALPPDRIPNLSFTDPPQAMDLYPQCKVPGDTVQAYRNYYKEIKSEIAEWPHSEKPYWYDR